MDRAPQSSDDDSNDGLWQRMAAAGLAAVIDHTDFAGGILIAITPANRIVPVMLLPDYECPLEAAIDMLRQALGHLEAGHVQAAPRELPPDDAPG